MTPVFTTNRRPYEQPARLERAPDTRKRDWFDYACAAVCVALTLGTIAFVYGSQM